MQKAYSSQTRDMPTVFYASRLAVETSRTSAPSRLPLSIPMIICSPAAFFVLRTGIEV